MAPFRQRVGLAPLNLAGATVQLGRSLATLAAWAPACWSAQRRYAWMGAAGDAVGRWQAYQASR